MTFERFARSERGQAIVEIAITAPFLLALLVSVIDIGRLNHYRIIVGNSARAAVQYGAQNSTTAADKTGQETAGLVDGQNLTGLSVVATAPVCTCSDGTTATCSPPTTCPTNTHILTYVKATSSYTFKTLFNYRVIPATFIVSRTETLEVAQ